MEENQFKWKVMSDGEANFVGIASKEKWVMRIQFNGEIPTSVQEYYANQIASLPELKEAFECAVLNCGKLSPEASELIQGVITKINKNE